MNPISGRTGTLASTYLFASVLCVFCFASSVEAQIGFSTQARQARVTGQRAVQAIGQQYEARGRRYQAQRKPATRTAIPSQMPSVLFDLATGGVKGAAGGLATDVVLGRVYSQKRGYYGNRFLPSYLRARKVY